jgi:hypothetical protein
MEKKMVIVETPFMGRVNLNIRYARLCLRDCLLNHNEYPFASHLLYTQRGILNDNDELERKLGIEAGLFWGKFADLTAVYTDLGISGGMEFGIKNAEKIKRPIEYRQLGLNWEKVYEEVLKKSLNHPFLKESVMM